MKIGILGPKGTFSDNAARKYLSLCNCKMDKVYYPSIDDVFYHVGSSCDLGIIPIENTLDGYVQRTLDLLLEMNVHIIDEVTIPVKFSLIASSNSINDIEKIFVQFKANGQCRNYINTLIGASVNITESNMESFNKAESGKLGSSAIIPHHMLSKSKLPLKIDNVTDSDNNFTRFIVVKPENFKAPNVIWDKRIKASLYVMPKIDKPGVLFDILRSFSDNNINLVSIISQPTKKNMGTYNFFIEINGAYSEKDIILETLENMKHKHTIKILGMYSE